MAVSYRTHVEDETHLQVGLHHIENVPTLVTPKFLDFENDFKSNALLLIRVLEKYKHSKRKTEHVKSTIGSSSIFYTYIWIIRDFFENGLYEEKIKLTLKNAKGKIDFIKTIRKEVPYLSNGNYVYIDNYATVSTVSSDNYLQEIQKYAVKKSIEEAGWLLGLSKSPIGFVSKVAPKEALYFLKNTLSHTNSDTQIELLKKLIAFYQNEDYEEALEIEKKYIKVDDFKEVFNEMIKTVYQNTDLDLYLKGMTVTLFEEYKFDQSFDILRLFEDKAYLAYAYYNYNGNLPSKSEIYKILRLSKEVTESTNTVIFVAGEVDDKFKYLGFIESDGMRAHIFKISLEFVMRAYAGFETTDKIEEIFKMISDLTN